MQIKQEFTVTLGRTGVHLVFCNVVLALHSLQAFHQFLSALHSRVPPKGVHHILIKVQLFLQLGRRLDNLDKLFKVKFSQDNHDCSNCIYLTMQLYINSWLSLGKELYTQCFVYDIITFVSNTVLLYQSCITLK